MIDLHSHILFETDDGSNNIEESIKMAKEAFEAGFTTICCTPHYLEPIYIKTKKENEEKLNKLKEALEKENIKMELLLGNEIFVVQNIDKLIKEEKVSRVRKIGVYINRIANVSKIE
jgi:protein-tyrosine phosphatase